MTWLPTLPELLTNALVKKATDTERLDHREVTLILQNGWEVFFIDPAVIIVEPHRQ